MNKLLILFFSTSFLFAGCTGSNDKTTDKDSANNKTDTGNIYKKALVNLSANENLTEVLCQGWELEDDLEALTNSNDPSGIYPFRAFYLSPDFTFIKNPRNAMVYGSWVYDASNKTITLNAKDGSRDVYKIGRLDPKELIVINSGIGSVTQLKYVAGGMRYADKGANPYHISNNQWRIASKKPEADPAIRNRLKAFLKFHILFYRDNLAREQKAISFYGFPTCIKWYAGGIFIIKKEDLADNWFTCFYNKEQAMKAYMMMDEIIGKKYNWPKEKMSWVKKNLMVLEQMYDRL